MTVCSPVRNRKTMVLSKNTAICITRSLELGGMAPQHFVVTKLRWKVWFDFEINNIHDTETKLEGDILSNINLSIYQRQYLQHQNAFMIQMLKN